MQVWNVLHAARWKCRYQKSRQKSPSEHHPTSLSGYIFATKACIDNRKKLVKQQYLLYMSPQYGELRPTSGWDRFVSLGYPGNFNGFRMLAALLHGTLVVGVSQTAAFNWGRHVYLAGQPSRWPLAHISSLLLVFQEDVYLNIDTTTTTTVLWPFVRDYPDEPVPEETLTHPPSWSSSNLYQLLPSTTIHSILPVQITCLAIFLHNLFPCPLWSTSWSGVLHLIFHTFLHPISVFFLQHIPIPSQPVLL